MINLGRISIFFILLTTYLFANVTAKVDPDIVYAGDTATYTLTISGEDIKKPNILDICGNNIVSTSSQTSIVMVNGNYKKSYTLSYGFVPQKSCVIKPTEVQIGSKIEKSNSVNLKVKPMSQDLSANFVLSLTSSKKEVYVGEPFKMILLLKQRSGSEVADSKFVAPNFKGFWIKSQSKAQRINDGGYAVTKVVYTLAAQRDGNLSINPAQLKIATNVRGRNSWGAFMPQVRWKSYYSNKLNMIAKALPNGATIIGNLKIQAIVQKSTINENEAVNVTVKVLGDGNLEDIESFKPYVDNVNVFDEKIKIKNNELTQKLAFVSDSNFTIPSFSLTYFSLKTKKMQTINTDPIDIVVKGSLKHTKLEIKRDESKEPPKAQKVVTFKKSNAINMVWLIMAFVVGLSVGIFIMKIKSFKNQNRSKKIDIKDEKLLLIKLLPFEDDEDVKKIIDMLESNIYGDKKEVLDKKIITLILEKYDIS